MKKKVLAIVIVSLIVTAAVPAWVVYKHLQGDMALREHLKLNLIPGVKEDFGRLLSNSEVPAQDSSILSLELQIPDGSLKQISSEIDQRIKGLNDGAFLIGSGRWTYQSATVLSDNDTIPVTIRIRGDMPSNYNKGFENASWRINISGKNQVLGCQKFSLVRPYLENGLYGYYYYKYMLEQGLAGSNIHMVRLTLNGRQVGLYFFQEWFDKSLLKAAKVKDGIIFKPSNDCVSEQGFYNPDLIPPIEPYRKKSQMKTGERRTEYARAIRSYNAFKYGEKAVGEIFDIPEMAKFIAVVDLFPAHHNMLCQNVKLYWNPASQKFGPIAWDPSCLMRLNNVLPVNNGFNRHFGELVNNPQEYPYYGALAEDSLFCASFNRHLWELSDSEEIIGYIQQHKALNKAIDRELFVQSGLATFKPGELRKSLKTIRNYFTDEMRVEGLVDDNGVHLYSRSNLPLMVHVGDGFQVLIPPKSHHLISNIDVVLGNDQLKISSYPVGMKREQFERVDHIPILLSDRKGVVL